MRLSLLYHLSIIWVYSADVAQQKYEYYLKAKGPKLKIDNDYELKEYIEKGLIQFYKVTSLTGNKESIVSAMPYKVISSEELTFETIFQTAI